MSEPLHVWVEGIGCWSPGLADWPAWRALLRGTGAIDATASTRPRAARLATGERRRASTHVLAAIEVAEQALAMSGRDGAELACIFASAYGDAAIMDYMCTTLAKAPNDLSPTRFHHSVHNAAAGYWTIASGSRAASQAVAAGKATFAAALLEAAVQMRVEGRPVLLVSHDEPGSGPLAEVFALTEPFASALVLSPATDHTTLARLDIAPGAPAASSDSPRHAYAARLASCNPAARSLALLEALATRAPDRVTLVAARDMTLTIDVDFTD